jgi:hypothetical protein
MNDPFNFTPEKNEETLSGLTAEDLKSLESERLLYSETESQMAGRMFRQNLVPAVRSLTQIALHSSNEKLRADASKYIIERNLGRVQDNPPAPTHDPMQDLYNAVFGEQQDDYAPTEETDA